MLKTYSRITALLLFIILFIAVIVYLSTVNTTNKNAPSPQQGRLNLETWNFVDDGLVALNGEWEYYDKQLLNPEDFKQQALINDRGFLHVPGTWGGIDFYNDIDKKGYGTYRLLIDISKYDNVLALKVNSIRFAHHLYVNGVLLGQSGVPSKFDKDFSPGNTPYLAFFTPSSKQIEIIIQVSNFHFPTGGIINPIILGSAEQLSEYDTLRSGIDMSLILILIFIGLYCFILYFIGKKNTSYLFIGLYMITIGINNSLNNGKLMQRVLDDAPFELLYELQDIVQFVGGIAIFYFISSFEVKLLSKKWMHILFIPIYIYLITVILFSYEVHVQYKYYIVSYLVFIPVFILFRLVAHYRNVRHNEETNKVELIIVIMACIALVGYVASFFMYPENMIQSDLYIKIFIICFTLLMLLVMTLRYGRIQKQTEMLTEQLMLSNEQKDEFLLNTSHELKTPLHGVQNMVSYLLSSDEKSEEEVKHQLWLIRDTTVKLSLLVNDLIDASLLKHGEIQLNIKVVDLKVAVDIVLDLLTFEISGKKISMVNNVPHYTFVEADEMRLRQILYNLVHNAIKFTHQGVIVIHAKSNDMSVSIWVKDTGIGMASDRFNSIFKKFEQLHKDSNKQNDGGIGVGLYLSRKLALLMHGDLSIEWSEVGKGTHVHLKLPKSLNYEGAFPIKANTEVLMEKNIQIDSLDYINGHQFTILVIDDEVSNILSIVPLLKQISCNVLTAFSAKEGLQKMENFGQVDLVILDMMMPEMSGIELCKILREKYSILDLPIIFTTVKDAPSDITQAFRAGANDFVTKPFAGEILITRIQTLLAMKTAIQDAINNELAFNHAQIKPHFLYNAISSVIAFCYEDGEKAAHLLTLLSKYLRYILEVDRKDLAVPLTQELELIDAYIQIEKARFGEQLTFNYSVDDSLKGISIPFLSLQPFVENAIRHGIFNDIENGYVLLEITKAADMICIKIKDNGKGIEPSKLAKLQQGKTEGDSIAIANIYRRISLIPKASIIIESKLGVGTTVKILIPDE